MHRLLLPLLVLLACASPVSAEVELTPALGLRVAGAIDPVGAADTTLDLSPAYGVTLDLTLRPEKYFTLLWSRQSSEFDAVGLLPDRDTFELDVDYLHVGGAYRPRRSKKLKPFVMATLGLTWVQPEPSSFGSEIGFSMLAGGGFIRELGPRTALRLDLRGFFNITGVTLSGTCGGVGCSVRFSGGGGLQFETLFGVSFRLGERPAER